MSHQPHILAMAGSLREDSFNRCMLSTAIRGAEAAGARVTHVDLREYRMPVFDQDEEAANGLPESARRLKKLFFVADGLLIASPEYNSSITAVLKNTLDWVSRKEGDEAPVAAFKGKVATIMSASPGGLGGLRGLVHLRSILGNIGVIVLPDQTAISSAHDAMDADGALTNDRQRATVESLGGSLAEFLKKHHAQSGD